MIRINRCIERRPHVEDMNAPDAVDADTWEESVTFRELVRLMERHPFASCSPATGAPWEWIHDEPETDYRTGASVESSVHLSPLNPPRVSKYWEKAMRRAGIIKGAA